MIYELEAAFHHLPVGFVERPFGCAAKKRWEAIYPGGAPQRSHTEDISSQAGDRKLWRAFGAGEVSGSSKNLTPQLQNCDLMGF